MDKRQAGNWGQFIVEAAGSHETLCEQKRSLIVNERCVRVEGESKHSSGSYASVVARAVLIGSFPQLVSEAASTFILQ